MYMESIFIAEAVSKDKYFRKGISYNSVVQLLSTYGPFYKNVETRRLLTAEWCIKQQIHKIPN